MISIIVCSKYSKIDDAFAENIKDSIGKVDYEIVWIDNSKKKFSIFEAYNNGVKLSKGDILCFVHEDVVFHSLNWGENVLDEFNSDSNVGMLGVVGGHILTSISTCWWSTSCRRGSLIQGNYLNGNYISHRTYYTNNNDEDKFVVAIDGVWMVIRKILFDKISFDSNTYIGFHFYDMDISMQIISLGYKILIVDGVDIEHRSSGNVNGSFYRNCIEFHKKWDYMLPVYSSEDLYKHNYYSVSLFKKLLYQKVYFPLSYHFFNIIRSFVVLLIKLSSLKG